MTPKVPFKLLRGMGDMLKKKYDEDLDAYWEGRHIYGVEISPETGNVTVHVQVPLFMQMVQEHANGEAVLNLNAASTKNAWYHCRCMMHGIELTCCLNRFDLESCIKELELPEGTDLDALEHESIESLLGMYQQFTGWNLKADELDMLLQQRADEIGGED